MAKTIAIKWNQPRLHIIAGGGTKDHPHGEITLTPGVNVIDAQTWENIRANKMPVIEHYVSEGDIEEAEESEGDLSATLPKQPAPALKLIRETYSVAQLEKWATDPRPAIQDAIKKQIEKVNAAKRAEPKPESDE